MKITGSIVTYNNARTIEKCIESVLKQTAGKDYDFKLYVYDNGSEDDTPMIIQKKYPEVTLVCSSQNRGFGYGHNAIIKKVKSDYHFVINPDIFMDRDAIGFLAKELEKDDTVGLATPKILNSDGTEQFLPKYCPTIRYVFVSKLPGFKYLRRRYTRQNEDLSEPTDIEFCTGCFFGTSTAYIKEKKGFSNRFFMYCEDTDLSRRVRKEGKRIVFYPGTAVHHDWQRENTGNLRGIYRFIRSLLVYYRKWGWEF